MFRQMPGNLHRAIDGFTLDRFVDKTPGFSFTRTERLTHKDVPKRGRHADGPGKPLRSTCAGQKTKFRVWQSDQIIAVFGDADVAGQSKFKSAGKSGAGNGGNNRFRHRLADRHGLIEKSAMVACAVRPLAPRSANLLGNLNERGNIEMAIKISGRSAGYDDDANIRVAGESLQLLCKRVAHRHIEIHSLWTSQGDDGNSIDDFRCKDVGFHRRSSFLSSTICFPIKPSGFGG